MNIKEAINAKITENGDLAFKKASTDNLINLLFMAEYFSNHLDEAHIGGTEKEALFAMFLRDPRFGLGYRDLGRKLMHEAGVSPEAIVKAGRFDDLYLGLDELKPANVAYLKEQIEAGNELAKKWAPRYSSKHLMFAREFARRWGLNKQEYGHFIKCNTTENKLSRHETEQIDFEQVPSLALIKYYQRFKNGEDTKMRFARYLEGVKSGERKMNMSTTNVYDIYKNRDRIDADLFFEKLEKIKISCMPIVDTSGSMMQDDALGKAVAIGHYLAKCSTYLTDHILTFSSHPKLLKIHEEDLSSYSYYRSLNTSKSHYQKEINSLLYDCDCTNTDFGAVMKVLKTVNELPEYLIVLSDMEFDQGSNQRKEELYRIWRQNGYKTKIVWWNFNGRNKTAPEMDDHGNVFLSGYNPMLLKFLEAGFDASAFLDKLLEEYKKAIGA